MLIRNLSRRTPTLSRPVQQPPLTFSRWLQWQSRPCPGRPFTCARVVWQRKVSKESHHSQIPAKFESPESVKPETVQKPAFVKSVEAPKTDGLLSEQTVSNKEQRKADWAIMKEMARYLWPKVYR